MVAAQKRYGTISNALECGQPSHSTIGPPNAHAIPAKMAGIARVDRDRRKRAVPMAANTGLAKATKLVATAGGSQTTRRLSGNRPADCPFPKSGTPPPTSGFQDGNLPAAISLWT